LNKIIAQIFVPGLFYNFVATAKSGISSKTYVLSIDLSPLKGFEMTVDGCEIRVKIGLKINLFLK
jgi:hypothetical protein